MDNQKNNIKFNGTLHLADESKVSVATNITFDKLDATSLDIEILVMTDEKEARAIQAKLYAARNNDIIIENEWDRGSYLEINGLYGVGESSGALRIDANSISHGIKGKKVAPGDLLIIVAKFTPGGLLGKDMGKTLWPDGNIKIEQLRFKDAYWETDIGTYNIHKAYEYFEYENFERKTTKAVEATHTNIQLEIKEVSELSKIRDKVISHLDIISSALSLSFRVPVQLYELDFSIIENDNERKTKNYSFQRVQRFKLLSNQKEIARDPLIEIRNLSGKKFHYLASNIQNSIMPKVIRKSIHFLSLSRTKYLEESYFYCFLALDSLIEDVLNAYKLETSIPSRSWKIIEKSLRGCLDEKKSKKIEKYLPDVKEKLPELKRYAFHKKVFEVTKLLSVDTKGLWKNQSFSDGLKAATKIRNNLFHAGHIDSVNSMHANLVRLQFLTERIILRAIKWKQSNLWVWNEQELKGVNMS